jgi:hypothetical protein
MKNKNTSPKRCNGAKTRTEIASEYGMSTRTLMRRLEKAGITLPSGNILPRDQKRIYDVLGMPEYIIPPRKKDIGKSRG